MTAQLTPTSTARDVASAWLARFAAAIESGDAPAVAETFLADGHLRDHLALTWSLRTFSGRDRIAAAVADAAGRRRPTGFEIEAREPQSFRRKRYGPTVEAFFRFETDVAWCRGYLRLLLDEAGRWRAWAVFTSVDDLKGHEEPAGTRRPKAPAGWHGPSPGGEGSLLAGGPDDDDPAVVVVGAGQAGLTAAARLCRLGVPTLVVEREPRVGDVWRNRYRSLVLHNQVWANQFPYLAFPSSWPEYLSKDQLADWLECYAQVLSLPVRTSTHLGAAAYDETAGHWELRLERRDGHVVEVHPRHVVLATGVFGAPDRPEIPGIEDFCGTVLHVAEYRGEEEVAGSRALVVGAGTSAHDVAQDLHRRGATVTMLQRSPTCVLSLEPGAELAYAIYREGGTPLPDCDMIARSYPFAVLAELHKEMTRRIADLDGELLAGLRRAGFALDFGTDGSGFLLDFYRHGGGYYINVGASDLVVSGDIRVAHGAVERFSGRTASFGDGTTADFDLVVLATGYRNMQHTIGSLFGDEVARRVGPVWGLDAEGELRAMWRPTGQPGLWVAGGSLLDCRPYSKYLALQIKARELGLIA